MAKQRVTERQGRRDHRRRPRDRQGDGGGAGRQGLPGRDRRPRRWSWPSRPRASSAAAPWRCRSTSPTAAPSSAFLDEAERQLGPARRGRQQRRDHAGDAVRRGVAEDSFRRQIDINLIGVITGTQLAIERLRPRGEGHIVNIASQAGKAGIPGIATYSATKHAVVGLSEAVRAELRGTGVEVACVMPTVVNTELTAGVGQRWVKPVEAEDVADAIVDALEVPRFDVFVPKANAALLKGGALLPRGAREWVARAMGTDKLMTEVDHGARRAYEERAAHSEGTAARRRRRGAASSDAGSGSRVRRLTATAGGRGRRRRP